MTNPSLVRDTQLPLPEQESTIGEQLDEILSPYQGREDELIPILQQVQQEFGHLPEPAIKQIARLLHLPEITIFGVATFYSQFKLVPMGRNIIKVCRGTACHVRGGARVLKEVEKQLGIGPGETTPDLEYSLETVACIGACALAPTMTVDDETYGQMTTKKVTEVFGERSKAE